MKREGTKGNLLKNDKKPPTNNLNTKNGKQITTSSDTKDIVDPFNVSLGKDIGQAYNPSDQPIVDEEPPNVSEFPPSVMDTTKNENKLDLAEILDDRWNLFSKFFNKYDYINHLMLNKNFGKLSVSQLINDLQIEILENENKLKQLKEVSV
jgi:hypothetical protein